MIGSNIPTIKVPSWTMTVGRWSIEEMQARAAALISSLTAFAASMLLIGIPHLSQFQIVALPLVALVALIGSWATLYSAYRSQLDKTVVQFFRSDDPRNVYLEVEGLPNQFMKRIADIVISLATMFFVAPVFISIMAIIRLDGGPIFYTEQRIGRYGVPYRSFKFRTMSLDRDETLKKSNWHPSWRSKLFGVSVQEYDPRVTLLGHFLRRLSLDELPQLWNVLHGDMSLVGPRAVVRGEETAIAPSNWQLYRQFRPGITGLSQIVLARGTPYNHAIELDTWYASHWSIWFDIVILSQTLMAIVSSFILHGDGEYASSHHAINPNGTKSDNFSTRGDFNSYADKDATKPGDGE